MWWIFSSMVAVLTRPSLDGREEILAIHELAIRHFQVQTTVCRSDSIICSHPIRHHDTVETPLFASDLRIKVGVLGQVLTVEEIVGVHDAPTWACFTADSNTGK